MNHVIFDFDTAIGALDSYVQKKTTHSTKDLLRIMTSINEGEWSDAEDHQDFAQQCSNFDLWLKETGRTSMGRKQFEEWWNMQGSGEEPRDWSDEALIEIGELEVDPLPEVFGSTNKTAYNDDPFLVQPGEAVFTDINLANAYIRAQEEEIAQLKRANEDYLERLRLIKETILKKM